MSRGYHLINIINLEQALNQTCIEVLDRKTETDRFALKDRYGNTCMINLSTVYGEGDIAYDKVTIRVLDFYGKLREYFILNELFQKCQVLFYTDSEVEDCMHEDRELGPKEIAFAVNQFLDLALTEQQIDEILNT